MVSRLPLSQASQIDSSIQISQNEWAVALCSIKPETNESGLRPLIAWNFGYIFLVFEGVKNGHSFCHMVHLTNRNNLFDNKTFAVFMGTYNPNRHRDHMTSAIWKRSSLKLETLLSHTRTLSENNDHLPFKLSKKTSLTWAISELRKIDILLPDPKNSLPNEYVEKLLSTKSGREEN